MNRSRSSSRALGRSHCKHLGDRRGEAGEGQGRWGEDRLSHVAVAVLLRGEERAGGKTVAPSSPLRWDPRSNRCN